MKKKLLLLFGSALLISPLSACSSSESTFTVTWKNYDGTVLEVDKDVQKGELPSYDGETPVKPHNEETVYIFDGWSPSIDVEITKSTTFVAQYFEEKNDYTITWKNSFGLVLATEHYKYGETPTYKGTTPTKDATAQYTYTFAGWNPEIVPVVTNAQYFAKFDSTVNEYTIKWSINGDVTEETYEYGQTPTYKGNIPTKEKDEQYTYTFAGWEPAISSVEGEVTYVAQFANTLNQFVVSWKNYDGTLLADEVYNYGDQPSYKGATPRKVSNDPQYFYKFTGWDRDTTQISIKENITLTAQFNYEYAYTFEKITGTGDNYRISKCFIQSAEDIVVPSKTLDDMSITEIGSNAFYAADIDNVTISDGITTLSESAFRLCNFKNVLVPNSVTSIANAAFSGCASLESMSLPFVGGSSTTNIYFGYIFGGTGFSANYQYVPSTLKNITITGDMSSIGQLSFYKCSSLESISFPDTVTTIGNQAFDLCASLTSVELSENLAKINAYAFRDCSSLTNISKLGNITAISLECFKGCSSLKNIDIPETVTSIDESAFSGCSSLEEIVIPNSVKVINSSAFSGCASLISIDIPNSIASIGNYAFSRCKKLKSIVVPNSVTSIGFGAFHYCSSLETF